MEVISYNIQFGRGLDGRVDLGRIADSVKGADLICLQEVESGWLRGDGIDQAKALCEILPEYYAVYGSSFEVDISYKTDDGKVINQRRQHGVLILSRWPILSSRCFNLHKQHYADKFNMQMSFVESVIDSEIGPLRVYSLHAGYLAVDERLRQFEQFLETFRRSPEEQGAWSGKSDIDGDGWSNDQAIPPMPRAAIVCGDFNCHPGSREYQHIVENSELHDCWQLRDPGNLNQSTRRCDRTEDIEMEGKIDHIFVSSELVERVQSVMIDQQAEGSDHRPVRCQIE
jgi:endonuclease/exonuclease/phosphatase family metal-dependent hydrolase